MESILLLKLSFSHGVCYLHVVWPQYNPSTETIAQIDHSSTTAEPHYVG